jgi:hypothetical protein
VGFLPACRLATWLASSDSELNMRPHSENEQANTLAGMLLISELSSFFKEETEQLEASLSSESFCLEISRSSCMDNSSEACSTSLKTSRSSSEWFLKRSSMFKRHLIALPSSSASSKLHSFTISKRLRITSVFGPIAVLLPLGCFFILDGAYFPWGWQVRLIRTPTA